MRTTRQYRKLTLTPEQLDEIDRFWKERTPLGSRAALYRVAVEYYKQAVELSGGRFDGRTLFPILPGLPSSTASAPSTVSSQPLRLRCETCGIHLLHGAVCRLCG